MPLNKNNCPIGNMRYLKKKKKKEAGEGERGIFKSVSKLCSSLDPHRFQTFSSFSAHIY